MATSITKEDISDAYEEVRNDESSTNWLLLKYEGNTIVLADKGESYDELISKFTDDERAFAFARIVMGDELSKRAKFVFITWAGPEVGGIKRAKMSTDKSVVKTVIRSFAAEINGNDIHDVSLENVKDALIRAGGANYGTGVRE